MSMDLGLIENWSYLNPHIQEALKELYPEAGKYPHFGLFAEMIQRNDLELRLGIDSMVNVSEESMTTVLVLAVKRVSTGVIFTKLIESPDI